MTNTNTMEISETDYDVNVLAAVCWMCGKHEWHDRAGYAFTVSECRKCSKPVCENDAETDFDLVGDPGYYTCTQWVCGGGC